MQDTSITTGEATYCPEDNKLRLYTGRVPREEYLKLKADGWKPLYKQREAGGGDFVATWTPSRYATALAYGEGVVLDEDMSPQDRAADRAERFSGYRDKRMDEATGHADRYDSQPAAHGYQSEARAERAAARHDRIGDRAVDAWDKAEYWQQRTKGVIDHALYKSTPGVRMGRIKELEAAIRKHESDHEKRLNCFKRWRDVAKIEDIEKQNKLAKHLADYEHGDYTHPVTGEEKSLYRLAEELTGKQIAELWLSRHSEPTLDGDEWLTHYRLRLAYEHQMLEAQGGRAAFVEMVPGGWIGGHQIRKVNKSNATGRVVSVTLKIKGDRWGNTTEGFHFRAFNIERLSVDSYRPPSPEDLAALEAEKKAEKASAPKKAPCPLINPTDEDAERLQAIWNERGKQRHCEAYLKHYGKDYADEFVPAKVTRITQAVYSQNSKGNYSKTETRGVRADAHRAPRASNMYCSAQAKLDEEQGRDLCVVRIYPYPPDHKQYSPPSVIVLTDKPQKKLPEAVWKPVKKAAQKPGAQKPEVKAYAGKSQGLSYTVNT